MNIENYDNPRLEVDQRNFNIRIISFVASTVFFIILLIISLTSVIVLKNTSIQNIIMFIVIFLGISASMLSIIFNLDSYSQIQNKIKGINDNLDKLNLPHETSIKATKTMLIFPIVSFSYICCTFAVLIILNLKCNLSMAI
jgi:hypothetical protein